MATPPGWAQDSANDNKYNATLTVGIINEEKNKQVSVQVDNTTGIIGLVADGAAFYQYDPNLNKWKIPTEGDEYFDLAADQSEIYINVLKDIGTGGLNTIVSTAKLGAVKVINGTSDLDDIDKLKEQSGYSSTLNNTGSNVSAGSTTAAVLSNADNAFGDLNNISNASVQRQYGFYVYPKNPSASKDDQDTIQFKQFQYGKRPVSNKEEFGVLLPRTFIPVDGSVTLSIPTGIRDSNRANWDGTNASPFALEAAKTSLNMMDNFVEGSKGGIRRAIDALQSPKVQETIKLGLAAKAAGLNNALARFNGAILNPNTELLFGGPGLRDFAYTIEMTPRNSDEAQEIMKIIRFFKEGMASRRAVGGLFLQSPNVFEINYLYKGNQQHRYINKVKKNCALRDCSIDYTPQNTYMTHEDGSMIAYRMTLQFTELEPVYYDDYMSGTTGPVADADAAFNINEIGF